MKINIKEENNKGLVVISGSVETLEETREIRGSIDQLLEKDYHIEIHLIETDSITSSLIGLLIRLIYGDKAPITIYTTSYKLFTLIGKLNLIDTLNIKYMRSENEN